MRAQGLGPRLAAAWAALATRHPILLFLVGLLLVGAAYPGAQHITPNFTYTAFFWPDDPSRIRFNEFSERFGSDETVVVAVHSPSGIFDPESAELMRDLTEDLWRMPDVIRVDSLANFKLITARDDSFEIEEVFPIDEPLDARRIAQSRASVEADPFVKGTLVSDDLTTGVAIAYLKPLPEGVGRDAETVAGAAEALVEKYATGDHELHMFGVPIIESAFKELAETESPRIRSLALGVSCLALLALFRRISGLVLPILMVVASVLTTIWSSGWLGLEITTLSAGIVNLMLAVSLTISVHLMSRFYHFLRTGIPRVEAVRLTIEENFFPTLLTSLTTALAFFACTTADLKIVAGFGALGGVGTLIAWLLSFTLLPLMLRWVPLWRGGRGKGEADEAERFEASPRAIAYVAWIDRVRVPILVGSAVLALSGVLAASQVDVSTNPMLALRQEHPLRQSAEFLVDEIGMLTFEIAVDSGSTDGVKDPAFLRKVEELQDRIEAREGVTAATSIVDILKQMNRVLHNGDDADYRIADTQREVAQHLFLYTLGLPQGVSLSDRVTLDNDAIRVSVSSRVLQSDDHVALTQAVAADAEDLGLDIYITGLHDMYQQSSLPIVYSVLRSMVLALVGIALLLGVALRSVRLVSMAMIVNIVPLSAGAAVFWMLGRAFDMGTVVGFSLALGIAVDDTVHIMTHYLADLREGRSVHDSLARVISHVAPALLTTTTILVGAALVYITGSLIPTAWFGVLLATVLTTALGIDLTLLPALLIVAGRSGLGASAEGGASS